MSETDLNQIIANNISKQLALHGRTQLELAEYVNVSQATVSNWCTGIKMPRMSKIDMICNFFHIERSDLIGSNLPPSSAPPSFPQCRSSDEAEMLLHYRALTESYKQKSKIYIDNLLHMQKMEAEFNITPQNVSITQEIDTYETNLKKNNKLA